MTELLVLGGTVLLFSIALPAVALMNRALERSTLAGVVVIVTGLAIAITAVNFYAHLVRR